MLIRAGIGVGGVLSISFRGLNCLTGAPSCALHTAGAREI